MQAAGKRSIHALLLDEITGHLATHDQKPYRAKQIVDWLYEKRVTSFAAMSDLPQDLRARLADDFAFHQLETVRVLGSADTTRKFLFRLGDGNLIESVLIPASPALYGERSDRRTICVSTQVGCAYGCRFCASGLDGFSRNLDAGEIVQQLLAVEKATDERIDNVVFMGMGEPLANFDNVVRAIRIINAPWGLEIGARHITVSTSGLAPQIRKLADEPLQSRLAGERLPVNLAVSLHAANDGLRDRLVPINRRYPLAALVGACRAYLEAKGRRLSFEWALIDGVNDRPADAAELAPIARSLAAHVNLIPLNPTPGYATPGSPPDRVRAFRDELRARGVNVTVRRNRGTGIDAACGQLRAAAPHLTPVAVAPARPPAGVAAVPEPGLPD